MQIKLFIIPASDTGVFTEELNRFLRANKVLEVENHLVSNERGSAWHFCVKYIGAAALPFSYPEKPKTDYKNELAEPTFKVFCQLKDIRKKLALQDAVPAYAICTDAELADIARLKELTPQNLATVKGFGDKKIEKYGNRFIQLFNVESVKTNSPSQELPRSG